MKWLKTTRNEFLASGFRAKLNVYDDAVSIILSFVNIFASIDALSIILQFDGLGMGKIGGKSNDKSV